MKHTAFPLFAGALLLSCGAAASPPPQTSTAAQPPAKRRAAPGTPPPGDRPMLAAASVRAMTSTTVDGVILRAVVGQEEVTPYLAIERIRRGATEGDPATLLGQVFVELDGAPLPPGSRIELRSWRGDDLGFVVGTERPSHICHLRDAGSGASVARCTTNRGGDRW